ncbi:TatD family hydrolase [Tepidanaerobacter syntrophicus]|uniref:TatD DNase family protein n=1 Tax=Tepidanaerobacter syntrophicus TaxID=224999 RepID=A0A0U9HE74_9FIRM|nr:TatD family hydrolase [Tepidanaerobacter syntrophicus]GAQ24806.1 TatD DNase family protein [Tepidanaerobacter syntrophicus]GLI18926.1 deoxyribonuclease [Tepidanaerobacter syntrophicus]
MFVDVHAHLDDEAFDTDRQEMIKKIEKAGIIVVNAGSDMASSRFSVKLAEEFDFIYACVGIHPHEAKKVEKDYLTELEELAKSPKVIAIGEIGLDYYYGSSEKDAQQKVFREQIELAKSLNLPVVVHDRDAHKDTADILKNIKPERGLMHCYSGSLEMAQEFIEMNFYFSFGGVITFKNAKRPKEVAAKLPSDRILLETDCPYMSPEPYRGKRNDPTRIPIIAAQMAALRGVMLEEIERITYSNFNRLFITR